MNKKRQKPYKREKAIDKDKYFIAFVIVLILLIINLFTLAYYKNKEKQEKIEYQKRQEEKLKALETKEKNKYTDIVFLGDSLTDYYDLDKYYNIKIINSGVEGWTTDDILNNLDEKVFKYYPKKLVLLIGTNDLRDEKDTKYIIENIKKIVEEIKKKRPYTKIYIESLYPINNTNDSKISHDMVGVRKNEDIQEINKNIKNYCSNNNFTYIDMHKELLDNDGNLKLEYTKEGLHMSDEGYKVITSKLKKVLKIK